MPLSATTAWLQSWMLPMSAASAALMAAIHSPCVAAIGDDEADRARRAAGTGAGDRRPDPHTRDAWQREFGLLGQVRGLGAMLALELVRDRTTREPAPDETLAVLAHALQAASSPCAPASTPTAFACCRRW